jgi:hypothetical protein
MSKAIAIFTGGITELKQAAIRTDGAVFKRTQVADPRYGHRWSAWAATGEVVGENARHGLDEMSAGFATLRRATPNDAFINNRALFDAKGEIKVRLP